MGFLLGWKEEERSKERCERTDIIQEREMERMVKGHLKRERERAGEPVCTREEKICEEEGGPRASGVRDKRLRE